MPLLETGSFLAVRGFGELVGVVERKLSLQRRLLFSNKVACAMALSLMISSRPASSEDLPVCLDAKNAVSISQTNVAPNAVDIHMEQDPAHLTSTVGVLHLYLRNEGATEPHRLCATAHFADTQDKPQKVSVTLTPGTSVASPNGDQNTACVEFAAPWTTFEEKPFDVAISVVPDFIPLSGSISLTSNGTWKAPPPPNAALQNGNSQNHTGAGGQAANLPHDCATSSKVLTRSVMLLPSITPSALKFPLLGAFFSAVLFFVVSLAWLWSERGVCTT
jgi:hypothetical protein